jgi:hypothetical protein
MALTFEDVMAILDKQHQDTLAKIEADRADMFVKMAEERKIHEEKMEDLSQRFGHLSNRFGDIIEAIISPNMCEKFEKYNFNFHSSCTNLIIKSGKKTIAEIDVLLEDGDCVMIVEVKTKPILDDIKKHLERIEKIQKHPTGAIKNKKVYGAIACALIDDETKDAIFAAGFYIVCHTGDNVEILEPPPGFVHRY